MRAHLSYRNFHPKVLKATEELFRSKPWSGTDDEIQTKYERWIRQASDAYDLPVPLLEVDFHADTAYNGDTIRLDRYSVLTMMFFFRVHMIHCGFLGVDLADAADDPMKWSRSLFYKVRPVLYRRAVRDGRVPGARPEELLVSVPPAPEEEAG